MPSGASGLRFRLRTSCVARPTGAGPGPEVLQFLDVKRFRTGVAAVLTLLWAGIPLAACLHPEYLLTAEEQECCRKMAGACEGHQAAHSCCKRTVRPAQAAISAKVSVTVEPAVAAFFGANSDFALIPTTADATRRWLSPIHSPPSAGDSLNFILRI